MKRAEQDGAEANAAPPNFAQALAATEAKVIAHTVRPGESVLEIAGRYDEAPRWLRKWNRLDGAWPRVGRPLNVRAQRRPPPREKLQYRTKTGDTVASVAVAHGIDARSLGRVLRRKAGAKLPPGELLELWVEPTLMQWIEREGAEATHEIPAGAWSVGAPDDGALANAVRIPDDPAWSLRFEHRAYGNTYSVRAAVRAFRDFRARSSYTGPLRVWSMSRHYGGALPDHHSHQSGRDLDVKLPQRADLSATLAVRPEWIDGAALWHLLAALADTKAVDAIFLDHQVQALAHRAAVELEVPEARRLSVLQFPRPPLSESGLTRHSPGHTDHLHVRFSCPPWAVFCTNR